LKYFIFFLFFIFSLNLHSQNKKIKLYEYGFNLSYLVSNHFSDFKELNEKKNCCDNEFTQANGSGLAINLFYSERLFSAYHWSIGLSYANHRANFKSYETKPTFILQLNDIKDSKIIHNLETQMHNIGITPKIFWNYLDFNLGFSLDLNFLTNSNFSYYELLDEKNGYTFENHSTERNFIEDEINNTNILLIEPSLSFSYDIPLNNKFSYAISPEIKVSYLLNNIISNNNWNYFAIYFGINFKKLRFDKSDNPLQPIN